MSATKIAIPVIDDFVANEPKSSSGETTRMADLLKEHLYGSIVPLLLLTSTDLYGIPDIGDSRVKFIVRRLERRGLRLRNPNESVIGRAKEVFGSVENVPIQALCLDLTPGNALGVTFVQGSSRVLKEIVKYDSSARLGNFMSANKQVQTETLLWAFFFQSSSEEGLWEGAPLRMMASELQDRLKPWVAAR